MEGKVLEGTESQDLFQIQEENIKQKDINDIPGTMFDQISRLQVDEQYGFEQPLAPEPEEPEEPEV